MSSYARFEWFFDRLSEVEQTRSRNEKYAILIRLRDSDMGWVLKQYIEWVFDSFRNYWVTVPKKLLRPVRSNLEPEVVWCSLDLLLDDLNKRVITGNTAKESVSRFIERTPMFMKEWVRRVINKKFVAGASSGTIDKLYPGLIEWFELQTCNSYDEKPFSDLRYIEPKMDGLRGVIGPFGRHGEYCAISRNGLPLWNAEHIVASVAKACPPPHTVVVDGEFLCDDWSGSMSILKTQTEHPDRMKLQFHAFDALSFKEFDARDCKVPLFARKRMLDKVLQKANNESIILVPSIDSMDPIEILYITETYLEAGWEGSIIKDPQSMYEFTRNDSWLKYKPVIAGKNVAKTAVQEDDFIITGAVVGYRHKITSAVTGEPPEDGNWDRVLRNFYVQPEGAKDVTAVGGGLSLEERIKFAALYVHNPDTLIGTYIQVMFQGRTNDGALRFPQFMRFRTDK